MPRQREISPLVFGLVAGVMLVVVVVVVVVVVMLVVVDASY